MTYCELCRRLDTIDNTIAWCRDVGLLKSDIECPKCGCDCREVPCESYSEKRAWRRLKKGCKKVLSLRQDSYFNNSKLS